MYSEHLTPYEKCKIYLNTPEGSYVFKQEHFVLKCSSIQIEQGGNCSMLGNGLIQGHV
jgi:hypothetical protein